MSRDKHRVLKTEIPIIGEATNFRDALSSLVSQFIEPALMSLNRNIQSLHARVSNLEAGKVNVNVNFTPGSIGGFKETLNILREPQVPIADDEQPDDKKTNATESN